MEYSNGWQNTRCSEARRIRCSPAGEVSNVESRSRNFFAFRFVQIATKAVVRRAPEEAPLMADLRDMATAINAVQCASTAALEEALMCKDRSAHFANIKTRIPSIRDFQESQEES